MGIKLNMNQSINIKLNPDIFEQDIKRISEEETQINIKFSNPSRLINQLDKIFKNEQEKVRKEDSIQKHLNTFSNYVLKICNVSQNNINSALGHFNIYSSPSSILTDKKSNNKNSTESLSTEPNPLTSSNPSTDSCNPNSISQDNMIYKYNTSLQKGLSEIKNNIKNLIDKNTYRIQPPICLCWQKQYANCLECILHKFELDFVILDKTIIYFTSQNGSLLVSGKDFNKLCKHISNYFNSSPDDLKSLLQLHFAHQNNIIPEKKYKASILYGCTINMIHYQLVDRLINLYYSTQVINSTSNAQERQKEYKKYYLKLLYKHFSIPETNLTLISNIFQMKYQRILKEYQNSTNPFSKLILLFFNISKGNTNIIDKIAIMLTKIYLGKSYLNEINNTSSNFTIIFSKNISFINNFLKDIFLYPLSTISNAPFIQKELEPLAFSSDKRKPFCHLTEYPASYLSNKVNIGELLKDKLMGNIVNIDASSTEAEVQTFSNLINSKTIKYQDEHFSTINYQSPAHYIRICQDLSSVGFNTATTSLQYDTIDCTGNLENAVYEKLDSYELFFLVTGFLNYGLDLLYNETIPQKKIINHKEEIDKFISEYCEEDSSDNNTFTEIFYQKYTKWFNMKIPLEQEISKTDFIKYIKAKYNDRYKKIEGKHNGQRKSANGIKNLLLHEDKVDEFIKNYHAEPFSKENFIEYFQIILNSYFPIRCK